MVINDTLRRYCWRAKEKVNTISLSLFYCGQDTQQETAPFIYNIDHGVKVAIYIVSIFPFTILKSTLCIFLLCPYK